MSNTKLLHKITLITSLGFAAISATSAQAGTDSADLELNTQVVANCTISAGMLDATGYDSIVTNKTTDFDKESNVTVICTKDAVVTIGLGQGNNERNLKSGNNLLKYELYTDSGREKVWGSQIDDSLPVTGTGKAQIQTVYMRVPKDQNVPAGKYADTVTATVTF